MNSSPWVAMVLAVLVGCGASRGQEKKDDIAVRKAVAAAALFKAGFAERDITPEIGSEARRSARRRPAATASRIASRSTNRAGFARRSSTMARPVSSSSASMPCSSTGRQ